MKRQIFVLLMLGATGSSYAGANGLDPELIDRYCNGIAMLSSTAMESHQLGVPLSQSLEIAHDRAKGTKAEKVARSIILKAYSTQRYSSEVNQERAISNFRDEMHLECFKDNS